MGYQEILSITESVAVICAAIGAMIGISSWRREAKWKRKAEVAEEVLLAFYKVQSVFEVIRHPLVGPEELSAEHNDKLHAEAAVTTRRYQSNVEAFNVLRMLRWKFRIVFPKSDEAPFEVVETLLRKVLASSYMLGAVVWPRQCTNLPEVEFQKHLKEMHELESWHWLGDDEHDPFKKQFDRVLVQVQEACSKFVA